MTSAPNRRQPLNGNKVWIAALFSILLLGSCDLLKPISSNQPDQPRGGELDPIQGRKVYDPRTGTYVIMEEVPTEKMDTIRWQDVSETNYPPIASSSADFPVRSSQPTTSGSGQPGVVGVGEQNSQLLTSYNVAVLLPYLADRFNPETGQIDENSRWALHFTSGLRMALDELAAEGLNLNVTLLDTRANEQTTGELVRANRDLAQAHLVIGPYRRENVSIVASQVRTSGQTLVSPYSAASNITDRNANFIQVNPTLESHCQAIMRHVYPRHNRDAIVLVAKDDPNEIARFAYFNTEYRKLNGMRDTARLQQIVVRDQSAVLAGVDLAPYLRYNDTTVFILPTWADESFVYAFMRKLDASKTIYQTVMVYGMPQWMEYERVDFEYYERLNVHVSSSFFVDPTNEQARTFRRAFFDKYGDIPREEAYVGYDVAKYFCGMLKRYGTRFQFQLEKETRDVLYTRYAFERVVTPTTTANEFPLIERWENKYLNILRFKNYRFERAN